MGHPVAHLLHLVEEMAGEKHGLAQVCKPQDQFSYSMHPRRVKAIGRLI